jgi:hypothetical protein
MDEFLVGRVSRALLIASFCAAIASCGTMAGTTAGGVDTLCKDKTQRPVNLKIRFSNGRPDRVLHDGGPNNGQEAQTVHVCPGDYVSWKADDAAFKVKFTGTPAFNWPQGWKRSTDTSRDRGNRGKKWEVLDVVSAEAPTGVALPYEVVTPSGTLDPQIIVDN